MSCEVVTRQLSLMLYGELTFDEEEQVHEHLELCGHCRREYERMKQLHAGLESSELEASPELLQNARRNLRRSLTGLQEAGVSPSASWMDRVRGFIAAGSFWKPAGAVALLSVGFLGGRFAPEGWSGGSRFAVSSLSEPVASRVRYVQPNEDGEVRIVVEEVRQRVLAGGLEDGKIRGLLLMAAREANDPGVRVDTMDLLKSYSERQEVRRALLSALQHDPNSGVRLKALEALRTTADQGETRRVLTEVLLKDENPGVRTQAIDLLLQKREPAMVGVLQELMTREDNSYVRMKCQKVLHEMNASAEIF